MKVIAICNLPDGIKLDHAWFTAEDGLYAQKVKIKPLPEKTIDASDDYFHGYCNGRNDCIDEIIGEQE